MDALSRRFDFAAMSMLHIAPEPVLAGRFRDEFASYTTADLARGDVDLNFDLTNVPLESGSYDVVYASHVLEHIPDDRLAIAEIRRILAPGGFAVLPVPIVCERTVEYPFAVESEAGHVRAPGPDYFERFAEFDAVEVFRSRDFGEEPQVYVVEDRTRYPNRYAPYCTPSPGRRHEDMVPVCRKRAVVDGDSAARSTLTRATAWRRRGRRRQALPRGDPEPLRVAGVAGECGQPSGRTGEMAGTVEGIHAVSRDAHSVVRSQ